MRLIITIIFHEGESFPGNKAPPNSKYELEMRNGINVVPRLTKLCGEGQRRKRAVGRRCVLTLKTLTLGLSVRRTKPILFYGEGEVPFIRSLGLNFLPPSPNDISISTT